jgi:UDP:flavonoid glycosyltransferase YjiC (YdhE family)
MTPSTQPLQAKPRRAPTSPKAKPGTGPRRRVLFIGEGSTLAHAVRPLALASSLPADRYEVVVATPERYRRWAPGHLQWLPLEAQTPETFAQRLRAGKPLFSLPRLEQYVAEDLRHLQEVKPDVVVGDFRLSLAASARATGTPYINISNAYWSPGRPLRPIRPSLDLFRGWPGPAAELAFRLLAPAGLRWHAKPMHQLLIAHGRDGVGRDVRRAFTEADLTLYADLPALFPEAAESPEHDFLGPISWEPPVALPAWWDDVPADRPIAYVTLGSSGDLETLERIVRWLEQMGHTVLLATAERAQIAADGRTVFVADYLPGMAACERADLVVCNGGSPTTTQALIAGRPVVGVASNMDQLLNMRAVQAAGAGAGLRADSLNRGAFERAVNRVSGFRAAKAAAALAEEASRWDPGEVLRQAIDRLAPAPGHALSSS